MAWGEVERKGGKRSEETAPDFPLSYIRCLASRVCCERQNLEKDVISYFNSSILAPAEATRARWIRGRNTNHKEDQLQIPSAIKGVFVRHRCSAVV